MEIDAELIKKIREETGVSVMDIKAALEEAGGDENAAKKILIAKGVAAAAKKSEREIKAGRIEAYVHDDKIGVLVEIGCETDFVARNDDFKNFAHEIAMQIAATDPTEETLLESEWIKDPSKTVQDLLNEIIQKLGENIKISRFVRYRLGE